MAEFCHPGDDAASCRNNRFEKRPDSPPGLKVRILLNFSLVVATLAVFCLLALSSFILVYKAWSGVTNDISSHDMMNVDPMVMTFILIGSNGCLEVFYILVWLWVGGPLWITTSGNMRRRPTSVNSVSMFFALQIAAISLVFQTVTTLYIVYVNIRYPGIHEEKEIIVRTSKRRKPWSIYIEEHHEELEKEDILVEPTRFFRQNQPVMLILFSISCFLKTIFLKHYEKLKQMQTYNQYRELLKAHPVDQGQNFQTVTPKLTPEVDKNANESGFCGMENRPMSMMETIPEESEDHDEFSNDEDDNDAAKGDMVYSGFHDVDDDDGNVCTVGRDDNSYSYS